MTSPRGDKRGKTYKDSVSFLVDVFGLLPNGPACRQFGRVGGGLILKPLWYYMPNEYNVKKENERSIKLRDPNHKIAKKKDYCLKHTGKSIGRADDKVHNIDGIQFSAGCYKLLRSCND